MQSLPPWTFAELLCLLPSAFSKLGNSGTCLPIWPLSLGWKLSIWGTELCCMSPLLPFLDCMPIQLSCGLDFCFCLFRQNIIFCLTLGLLWSLWDNTYFHIQLFSEMTVGPAVRTVWHYGDLYKIWVNDRNGNFYSHWVTVISSNVRTV